MKWWKKASLETPGHLGTLGVAASKFLSLGTGWFVGSGLLYLAAAPFRLWYEARDTRKETSILGEEISALEYLLQTSKRIAVQHLLRSFPQIVLGKKTPSGFRMTLLLPDDQNEHIKPVYRFDPSDSEGINTECNSQAQFRRGILLAGVAWEDSRGLYKREDIPYFSSDDEFQTYYSSVFRMPADLIARLSPHMKRVRSILCCGLLNREGHECGVLSVDSIHPGAFGVITPENREEELFPYVDNLADLLLYMPEW